MFFKLKSINQKVYLVFGLLITLVTIQMAIVIIGMLLTSGMRVFTYGFAIWTKDQKAAVISLQQYALTSDPKYFQQYYNDLHTIRGFEIMAKNLTSGKYDRRVVEESLRIVGFKEDDIKRSILLITYFRDLPDFQEAFAHWIAGNYMISDLGVLARSLNEALINKSPRARVDEILLQIDGIDKQITEKENAYLESIGKISLKIENSLWILQTIFTISIQIIALYFTSQIVTGLSRRLGEIIEATNSIKHGNYNVSIPIASADELGQLSHAINRLATELETTTETSERAVHSNKTKSLFLANVSHEIRTPLSAIIGYSDLMQDPQLSPEEKTKYSQIIKNTGAHLLDIINDILDLSKIEAGQLEINNQVVHLPSLLEEVQSVLEPKTSQNSNKFEIINDPATPEYIISDPQRLKQILFNVVGNSIKFTKNGQISLSVSPKSNHLQFHVKDTGIGISLKDQNNLFHRFKQGKNSEEYKKEGTGLGLALSKLMANLLGGDLNLISSKIGVGSVFLATVEMKIPGEKEINNYKTFHVKDGKILNLEKVRVLAVDDVDDNRFLIARLLGRHGAIVSTAGSGQEAIDMISAGNTYDVILMDIQMPGKNGYLTTRELRAMGYTRPIIALTANALTEDKEKCLAAGCNDYLSKPIDVFDFQQKIDRLMT